MVGESTEDTHELMEQISLLSGPSSRKQSSICCKPTYQLRKLENKGAIIVIAWNFLAASVYSYLMAFTVPRGLEIITVALGLTLPFAGWLADIRFGRYKVICWSMWIMWTASMLITMNSVVAQLVTGYYNIFKLISQILIFILAIGFGGYQANMIQFGLDQLQDASTTEITAFIRWYVWTTFSGLAIFSLSTQACLKKYSLLGDITVCTCITVVISAFFILNNELVREPTTQNPFKLIYKVIHYAIKHKHPQCRSAFTYCEDELPSRIDFGKSKYGGPFTTEQVEDVKTFFRSLVVIFIASTLAGEILIIHKLYDKLINLLQTTTSKLTFKECYTERLPMIAFGYTPIALFIPLCEFILYPFFQKCLPSIKIYQKCLAGMLLQIARVILFMTFDVTARKTYSQHYGHNITISCNHPGFLSWNYYRNWMAIPNLLNYICITMLCISGIEFLASQIPYSMRGLMVGTAYGSMFLFAMIGYGIYWPFTEQSLTWGTGVISCEFWYLLSVLLILIIFSGLLLAVGRWYKNRKREDVLPNEHIFAERYYSQVN